MRSGVPRFFGELLGWRFEYDAAIDYFHVDDHVQPVAMGIAGAAASAEVACYFRVADVEAARARVRELGGAAGETFAMGPLHAADCTDDQGHAFGIAELHPTRTERRAANRRQPPRYSTSR